MIQSSVIEVKLDGFESCEHENVMVREALCPDREVCKIPNRFVHDSVRDRMITVLILNMCQ